MRCKYAIIRWMIDRLFFPKMGGNFAEFL